jgi:hypothetical protein
MTFPLVVLGVAAALAAGTYGACWFLDRRTAKRFGRGL